MVVFQVAGQCGLGALDAAKEKSMQGVGVDADQGYLGEHIITSAQKKVDVAVETAVKSVQDDSYKGGANVIFDLKNERRRPRRARPGGHEVRGAGRPRSPSKIKSGEITDIPDTVEVAVADAPALELRRITKRFGTLVANDAVTSSCAVERSTRCSGRTARASRP